MRICNFSSGSDGNCTFIESDNSKILIDAGISCAKIVQNLNSLSINPFEIDAIFVTHDHYDHINGIDTFSLKYDCKVYSHSNCWSALDNKLKKVSKNNRYHFFDNKIIFNDLEIYNCKLFHDASHTIGYKICNKNNNVAIITDTGQISDEIINFAKGCKLIYIESNHDVEMLQRNPNYSYFLKSRILSNHGHLSNIQCAKFIEQAAINGTKQFILSHLSKENNTPDLAYNSVCEYLQSKDIIEGKHIRITVASTEKGPTFKLL